MDRKLAVIFIGIQGSGKTSFYKKYFPEFAHVNLDTFKKRSKERKFFNQCIEEGKSFVVDNTNPTKFDRQRYIPTAQENGYEIWGYFFNSPLEESMERNNHREGLARIPRVGVLSTYKKLEAPEYDEGFDKLFYVKIVDGEFVVGDLEKKTYK